MGSWQLYSAINRDVLDHDLAVSALPDAPVVPDRAPRRVLRTRVAAGLHAVARRLEGRRGAVRDTATAPC